MRIGGELKLLIEADLRRGSALQLGGSQWARAGGLPKLLLRLIIVSWFGNSKALHPKNVGIRRDAPSCLTRRRPLRKTKKRSGPDVWVVALYCGMSPHTGNAHRRG